MRASGGHRPRPAWVAVAAAAVVGALAPAAVAAPAPSSVSADPAGPAAVPTRTFSWTAVPPDTPGNPVTYEVAVTVSQEAPAAGQGVTGTSATLAMPEGAAWFHVRSVETGAVAPHSPWVAFGPYLTDTAAPQISAVQEPAANPRGWVNAPVTVSFLCTDPNILTCSDPQTFVGEGAGQTATGTATDAAGNTASVTHTVNVDVTPPAPAQPVAPASGAVVTSARPVFRWSHAADGPAGSGLQYYEVCIVGRGKTGSTWATRNELLSGHTLAPGDYSWYVRTVDNANNPVLSARVPFTVDPDRPSQTPDPPPGEPVGSGTSSGGPGPAPVVRSPGADRAPRPAVLRARAMRPAAGRAVRSLRPTLRWTRRHRLAKLYNVQIYELSRGRIRKVVTAFPKRTSYKVPGGKLRPGRRYVWRVWPYLGRRGYAKAPVGVSYFDVRTPLRRPSTVTLSARQLLINQRISQAAVRRVNALVAHLEGRPAPARAASKASPGRVRLSARQLRINQRISQAAVRRVNAVRARLDGRPAPARATAATARRGRVRLSARQLRINQRIAQAPVRRIREIRRELGLGPS